jgi:hypothetical protein
MSDAANPYRSPESSASQQIGVATDPQSAVNVTLVARHWNYRRFRLAGGVEAELAWNGWLGTISVNGDKAGRMLFSDRTGYHYQSSLGVRSRQIAIQVDVLESFFLTHKVSVCVDHRVVYSE